MQSKGGKGRKNSIDNLKSNKILIKLNSENYTMKRNLEEMKEDLKREKKGKEELNIQISALQSKLNTERNLCIQLKTAQRFAENKEKVQNHDLNQTIQVLEESRRAETEKLRQQMKKEKEKFTKEKDKLETELRQQIELYKNLEKQLNLLTEAKQEAESSLRIQLESNKKMALINQMGREKTEKFTNLEKELRLSREENKVMELLRKKAEERLQRMEHDLSKAGEVKTRLEKELVVVRRENFHRNTMLQEVRVQMSKFESNLT